jgi:ribosomal protein S18 acetylase RimI-like enzyme
MGDRAVRPLVASDRSWLTGFMTERWGAPVAAGGGRLQRLDDLPGFAAVSADGAVAGVVTYLIEADACEVVSIDAVARGEGVGTALLEAVCESAVTAGCQYVHLITTNDNVDALRFYQRRGFVLSALRSGAVDESRRMKPQIPLVGAHGIPIRDELVLVRELP